MKSIENNYADPMRWILWIALVGILILVVSEGYVFHKMYSLEDGLMSRTFVHYEPCTVVGKDTADASLAAVRKELDSLRLENSTLKAQLDNVVDDLRQETNNVINKLNGWLGFWMGTSTLLCIVIPLVCQYFIAKQSGREFENTIQSRIMALTRQYEPRIAELDKKIKDMDDISERMVDEIEKSRKARTMKQTRMQAAMAKMRVGLDRKLMEAGKQETCVMLLWNEMVNDFRDLSLETLKSDALMVEERVTLMELLIPLEGFISEYLHRTRGQRSRNHGNASLKIQKLFRDLEEYKIESTDDLRRRIMELENDLHKLQF